MNKFPLHAVLLVDEDLTTLKALQQLLLVVGCQIYQASSAQEALAILQHHSIDMIISDLGMSEKSSDCFLSDVAMLWPDTERIALTEHAESDEIIRAINRGKISRFIMKPWDDAELLSVVKKVFEQSVLQRQNIELQALTHEKNRQLEELTVHLEDKVRERTQQLTDAQQQLQQAYTDLKGSYRSIVRMFSTLTSRRLGIKAANQYQHMNLLMLSVAKGCGLEGKALKQIFYAWQLRNIGKLSFSDSILEMSYIDMSVEQQRVFHTHPLLAQAATFLVKPLYSAGQIIRQHKEYLDGSGYPKQLKADQIVFSAQILCVVNDYFELIQGRYQRKNFSTVEALDYLQNYAHEKYNPLVVNILEQAITTLAKQGDVLKDACLTTHELLPGVTLSRDLVSAQGVLLLSAGQLLDKVIIERIREIEFNLDEIFEVFVNR
ncbi:HD domain-containing phosphohydrolase [Neptunomonas antarctica]|uniref:Response regulator c-di-GMP phosphodiesterase, RpfG family, contains REC and HD-GYP domains n=1 Tax=Neptunomonas antarctica TaxID=619304 RepID=A0A1N7KE27_9GAMM|nr:HD domain-containing phosphohydrolase [Neptunomonas antarctica]SIS59833.1 Response regulator c-di-GMP phosphodiesterase, RpfG family, contains REC and HD-GYP domains [Neptunomonas antarctica]